MLELNRIYNIDCVEGMKRLPDGCIDMVITSPPYFNLRDYGVDGQIGTEASCDEYIDKLMVVFSEVHRVLKDGGACWINIDDVYHKQSLLCIPDRLKIKMVEEGWICRNEIIWHKPNAMPSSTKTRFNNDYEKLLFFVKSNKYFFNTQYEPYKSIVSKKKTAATADVGKYVGKYHDSKQESLVRQGMNKKRGEKLVFIRKNLPSQKKFVDFIRSKTTAETIVENSDLKRSKVDHWFRRDEGGFAFPSAADWNSIKWLVDDWSEEFMEIDKQLNDISIETDDILKNSDKGRIKRAVWSISTKAFKGCHYAPYPEELVTGPILACCPERGIVLDPFMGSGTSAVAAVKNNRNFIGFDLVKAYCEIANERLTKTKPLGE
jgi:DNA modification methylase